MALLDLLIFTLFAISAVLFVLNSYFSLKRDYTYLGNQSFAFAFLCMGIFSLLMGLSSTNLNLNLNQQLILLGGLVSLILGFLGMFISSLAIKVGAPAIQAEDIIIGGGVPLSISFVGSILLATQRDPTLGYLGFALLFIGLSSTGMKISNTFTEAMEDTTGQTKRKIELWTYSFMAFGVLSVIGWFIASLFADTEWGAILGFFAPLANLVGSSLMLYSFTLD